MKILVAVDGSKPSLKAVQFLIDHVSLLRERPQIELVTVHLPVPVVTHVTKGQLQKYYSEECEERLARAKKLLDAAGFAYQARSLVGQVAQTIVKHAKDKRCDLIYIGTRGHSALGGALVGSTAIKVLHISDLPVLLVK